MTYEPTLYIRYLKKITHYVYNLVFAYIYRSAIVDMSI